MKYRFVREFNQEFDIPGWLAMWQPDFEPFDGVAHDVLEHFNPSNNAVSDELMAVGAMIAGRGNGGAFNGSVPSVVANELYRLYRNYANNTPLSQPPAFRLQGSIGDTIEETISLAFTPNDDEYETLSNTQWETREQQDFLRGWLWRGYQCWKRRFKNPDPTYFSSIYQALEERVDAVTRDAEIGMELVVDLVGLNIRAIHCQERPSDW